MIFGVDVSSFTDADERAGSRPDPLVPLGLAELAASRDLSAIELSGHVLMALPDDQRDCLRETLEATGLSLILDIGQDVEPVAIGAAVENALRTGAELGAVVVRTTVSHCLEGDRSPYGLKGWKQHLAALVAPFQAAAEVAADVGIPFGVENHQDLTSEEMVWLCEEVASPHFGVVMDCGNALAVGEHPARFAERVMPYLKHVQLKDYVAHPTPSGWRLVRCPLGTGIVDFPDLVERFDRGAAGVLGCIELGARFARHVRLLEEDWWSTFDPRPWPDTLAAIRLLHGGAQAPGLEWRTPHERGEDPATIVQYEIDQFDASVDYVRRALGAA